MNKFWMLKGSLGTPRVVYSSLAHARRRAESIAAGSGEPCYVLECVAICHAGPRVQPEITWEMLPVAQLPEVGFQQALPGVFEP